MAGPQAATHAVRPYRASDPAELDALFALDQQCFAQGIAYSLDELRYFLSEKNAISLVAMAGEQVAGFIVAQVYPARATFQARIITIDVAPSLRRLGIASLLMDACEHALGARHVHRIRLEVAAGNAAAIQFYRGYKYEILATLPGYYPTGEDAFSMQKTL